MWPSWRVSVPRNHAPERPCMDRTYRSSPSCTTHIVTGLRNVPSRRSDASFELLGPIDLGELVTGPAGHRCLLCDASDVVGQVHRWMSTFSASRLAIARYPSGPSSRMTVRSNTRPG